MSRPLALLRSEPGWSASCAAAEALGIEVVGHPLFVSEAVDWAMPHDSFDGLLIGSATAFRHAGRQLRELRGLPVYAVGEATAHEARAAGFTVAHTGTSGLQSLLDDLPDGPSRLLRLGGEERTVLASRPQHSIVECTVYRMNPCAFTPRFAADLANRKPLVALHSAAAATLFAAEIDRLGLERGCQFLLALGPRIAKAAGLGWAAMHLADAPNEGALLAKARALCQ